MESTAVIYLSRFGNQPRYARAFLASVEKYPAGAAFDMIFIEKGFPAGVHDAAALKFRENSFQSIDFVRVTDDTFATNVFFEIASELPHETVLFFVSWSRLLAPNWLRYYLDAHMRVPGCGIVGATSGYEALDDSTPFPNVNIRSTGFFVSRSLFCGLNPGPLPTKRDGNLFEAGPNSMTRQIEARGLVPVIVDRNGKTWGRESWPASNTFRAGNQENLLAADNRTYHYQVGSYAKRQKLAILNWGDQVVVTRPTPVGRIRAMIEWNYFYEFHPLPRSADYDHGTGFQG